jgi:hypothetical protein
MCSGAEFHVHGCERQRNEIWSLLISEIRVTFSDFARTAKSTYYGWSLIMEHCGSGNFRNHYNVQELN